MEQSLTHTEMGPTKSVATGTGEQLVARDVSVSVWDVRVVTPSDPEMIADTARRDLVITIEDGLVTGGAGEHIARQIQEFCEGKPTPQPTPQIRNLGVPANYIPQGSADDILSGLGLDAKGIVVAVEQSK